MVLTVSFVISPVIGFLATVACASSRQLDASTAASGPHDFAVRVCAARLQRIRVHRIPPRVRDDREPPLCETGRPRYRLICTSEKQKYFCKSRQITKQPR